MTTASIAAPRADTEFVDTVGYMVDAFRLDRQMGQPRRLMILVEAAGMLPQIERLADPYGIPVQASGGFDSVTAKWDLSQFAGQWPDTEILHIGDFDWHGREIFRNISDDVPALASDSGLGAPSFTRLAVTPEQIDEFELPGDIDDPDKVQAEALPPDILSGIVEAAIAARIDRAALDRVLDEEAEIRIRLRARFEL